MATSITDSSSGPKVLFFDLIGTCVDWYSSILPALQAAPSIPALPPESLPDLAADWRQGFFKEARMRYEAGQPVEDVDVTHRRVLNWVLLARGVTPAMWNDAVRVKLVQAWHVQESWPDVKTALERLSKKYILLVLCLVNDVCCVLLQRPNDADNEIRVVLANGSTRMQIDIVKSSGLPFHTLFSSDLMKQTKVGPSIALGATLVDAHVLS